MPSTPLVVQLQTDDTENALYGLELHSVGARLLQHGTRSSLIRAELHVSIEGTLNPRQPLEKYSNSRFSLALEMTKHPTFVVPAQAVISDIWDFRRKKRIEIAERIPLGYRSAALTPDSLAFRVRCFDAAIGDNRWLKPLGKRLAKLAVEVQASMRSCGCEIRVRKSHAGIVLHDPNDVAWANPSYYLCGDYIPCIRGNGNRRHLPINTVVATFLDGEGFQLARKVHELEFPYDASRRRTLRWAIAADTSLPDLAGTPTKLRLRWDTDDEMEHVD